MSVTGALAEHPNGEASADDVVGGRAHSATGPPRKRIRVVFCLDNMTIGGTELNAVRTAERLDRSRFDLSVACLQEEGPLLARFERAGIPVVVFPIDSLYGPRTLLQGIRLTRYLARERVDVVHSHDHYNSIFATICARAAGTPAVIASRRWLEPPRQEHELLSRMAYRLAHRVLANSASVATHLTDSQRVRSSRVVVIPNFVDESAFEPIPPGSKHDLRRALGIPGDAPVVGIVANLSAVKDHATLLRAMAELRPRWPTLHLILVGDGPCRADLSALVDILGLKGTVHFAGLQTSPWNLHHAFDVSVLCSISEGFSNSIVEAMAAGRPVVATNVGGNQDAVTAGLTGLLVPPRDPPRLAAAIEELLRNPELRRTMGWAARERAAMEFTAATVVRSLESLYYSMLTRTER
ncbi:MAG: glycosyltransferase [Gemmatimonadaceae bacterium]